MSNFLRGLGQVAGVAGNVVAGINTDRRQRMADVLAAKKQADEEERNRVLASIAGKSYDPTRGAVVNVGNGSATAIPGLPEPAAKPTDVSFTPSRFRRKGAPDPIQGFASNRGGYFTSQMQPVDYEVEPYEEPKAPPTTHVATTTIAGPGGGPGKVVAYNTASGEQVREMGDAPPTSAKPTEAEQKEYTFYNLMAKAEPLISQSVASGKIRPAAVSAFLAVNQLPGGKMLGLADLARAGLNAEEQVLMRNMFDFAAGVKRKESGAAVSVPEVREVMDRYFPLQFGEADALTQDKLRARTEYLTAAKGAATPYMTYLERQGSRPAAGASGDPEFDALMALVKKKP